MQRREDIFMAGHNDVVSRGGEWVAAWAIAWVCSTRRGSAYRRTGKMVFLRYCEFHCVVDGKID